MSRPALRQWRASRHRRTYMPDTTDQIVIDLKPADLVAVDCAGWYFNDFGINTVSIESNDLAKLYYPNCYVEYDVLTHRPTYIDQNALVLLKHPWFLRYATIEQLIDFLNIWTQHCVILNFNPRLIQHNHLKYSLKDIVQVQLDLTIQELSPEIWSIAR